MANPSFDDVYGKIYQGWDRAGASADWNSGAGQGKWQGYLDEHDPIKQMERQQNDLLTRQKTERDTRFAANKSELDTALTGYQSAIPTAQKAAEDKYHVTDLLNFTNALNTRIKGLKGNEDSVGAEGVASAGQVDQAVNTNYLPKFLTANENLQRGSQLAQGDVNQVLDPYRLKISTVNDRIARESAGYDVGQQRELDSLLSRLQMAGQLSASEQQRATQLAIAEQNYKAELYKTDKAASSADRYVSVGSGLYDTQTGRIIQSPKTGGSVASGW